ncbi:MAG: GGDEF domain-containing protein [Bacillota bacterium]
MGTLLFYVSCSIVSITAVLISKAGHRAVNDEIEYERVKAMAATDPLTGLYNYRQFQIALSDALQEAARTRGVVSLIYLDLDGFREINNTYGHQSGDDTLKLVADVLRSSCREKDTISRPGGDEFTVVLPGASKDEAYGVVKRISANLLGVKVVSKTAGELPLELSASYGVATFPEDGRDIISIIKSADDELYRNKNMKNLT